MRPIERTVFGGGVSGAACAAGDGVGVTGAVGTGLLLWPNIWANLTSFQIPTEELTMNVEANVVMLEIAWSIFG